MSPVENKTLQLTIGVESLVGQQRSANEDSYAAYAPSGDHGGLDGLLLVADGMGGEQAGEIASQIATATVRDWAHQLERLHSQPLGVDPVAAAAQGLRQAIHAANAAIVDHGRRDEATAGLGTTLVVAALLHEQWLVAHVGDSRCYRLRGGAATLLTVDHTWVEQQIRAGVLAREEAVGHPQEHVLTRSLGSSASDEPELLIEAARAGDVLVLCSDGMSGSVDEGDLLAFQDRSDDPQAMAEGLAALADQRDGSDNVTVVVGRVDSVGAKRKTARGPATPLRRFLPAAAALALLASGYAAGTLQRGLTLEERAEALLQQANADLEAGREAEAEERLALAETLFRQAPQAIEARRRLDELFPKPPTEGASTPEEGVAAGPSGESTSLRESANEGTPISDAPATAESVTPSEAAEAEARAAESSSSSTEEPDETTNTP